MVIPVRNASIRAIVLLLGICPLWGFAADDPVVTESIEQQSYGPVGPSDTLAEIALKLKGDSPWHYHRWMYALYLKNPQAFFKNNINNLKLGVRLMIPSETELDQIDQGEAFRAVKVHLYMLEQERQEKKEKQETSEDLLLRARLQRLFSSNEMMQKESGELFERISALEEQMGSVVDRVLDGEDGKHQPGPIDKTEERTEEGAAQAPPPVESSQEQPNSVESESSMGWLYLLSIVILIYIAGFIWRRRLETSL